MAEKPKCSICGVEMEYLDDVGYVCVTKHCPTLDGEPEPAELRPMQSEEREA